MPFYRVILKKAWLISWRFRYLWFFGLFAALLGNAGEYEIISRIFGSESDRTLFPGLRSLAGTGIFSGQGLKNIAHLAATEPINFSLAIFVILLVAAITVFLVWLVIISQAALVSASAKIFQSQKTLFSEALNSGREKFWPVFFLNLINRAAFYLIFVLLLLPVFFDFNLAGAAYVTAFIIFIPLSIFISFIIKYSIVYAVIKGFKVFEAIKNGWQLFMDNWLISVEMSLLLALINFGIGLAAALVVLILAVPMLFLGVVFLKLGTLAGFWIVVFVGLSLFIGLILLTGAILSTFQVSAWTGLFLELLNGKAKSKLVRLFGQNTKALPRR